MTALLHYSKTFLVQLKNNWVREVVYRTNFLTTLVVDLIWMGVELSLFTVIYSHVPALAGWTIHQIYFFLGMFFAADALFSIFFMRNFWAFSDLVNKGDLDIMLTKPVHPLFLALTRWINLTGVFNVILGLIIMFKYASAAGFEGGISWLGVVFWMFVGLISQLMIRFFFCIWIFWTDRSWALNRLYFEFFSLATKPDTLYPKAVRYAILTVLPFAFIGSVPARALIHGLSPLEYLWVGGVLLGFLCANAFLWKRGIRRYQSASS